MTPQRFIAKWQRANLAGLADPANLDVLRKVFTNPEELRPETTTEKITQDAAARFAVLADNLRDRLGDLGDRVPADRLAHFLMKLMSCMFAEDIGLLPDKLFSKLVGSAGAYPAKMIERLKKLFTAMCKGGDFGNDEIAWFNGGLFADAEVIDLQTGDIEQLRQAAAFEWS